MSNSKQVLVMKKFPKMQNLRTGKYCSQAAHASLGAVLDLGSIESDESGEFLKIPLTDSAIKDWVIDRFTKITLYVETDLELISIHEAALKVNLPTSLIKDAGLTEFKGVPTLTAVAIGPGLSTEIDLITGHLPLF